MSSDQKAVITLINRSALLTRELNDARRANRDLERRLAESQDRVVTLEAQLADSGFSAETPPLRAA
jgi:hypothetical protein